jgi:hypothetical protein
MKRSELDKFTTDAVASPQRRRHQSPQVTHHARTGAHVLADIHVPTIGIPRMVEPTGEAVQRATRVSGIMIAS